VYTTIHGWLIIKNSSISQFFFGPGGNWSRPPPPRMYATESAYPNSEKTNIYIYI